MRWLSQECADAAHRRDLVTLFFLHTMFLEFVHCRDRGTEPGLIGDAVQIDKRSR